MSELYDYEREIEINGIKWKPLPGIKYYFNYQDAHAKSLLPPNNLPKKVSWELSWWRHLILNDLWFICYFVIGIPVANHNFWVTACREVQDGPRSHTLDLWARFHGKSSVITTAEVIQRILRNPEERIAIFSYSRPAATKFFRQIKLLLESSPLLLACFPDVLYPDPRLDSPLWSDGDGLIVKRKGFYKEATLEAHGLIEGMPTGAHYTGRVYDDIITADLVQSPDVVQRVKDQFDMSLNLGTGTDADWHRVIGTPYHHEDALMYIKGKLDPDGKPLYTTRIKPATVDGSPNGPSAYLPEPTLNALRSNQQQFYSQQLCNPTPEGTQKLNPSYIKLVDPKDLPSKLYKFMVVDPAGVNKNRAGDSWGIACIGVEPYRDDLGASNIYILDLFVEPMTEAEAMEQIVAMYCRNGRILKLGIEKVGISTMEIHVANALRARGRMVTLDLGNLVILRPAGRSKSQRIEANLAWALNNGKVHMSTAIPSAFRDRLTTEMRTFPMSKNDDALDSVSYVYDLIKDYRFNVQPSLDEGRESRLLDRYKDPAPRSRNGWMVV